jgi:tetratricopeptide (TPR) repeat protein
MIQLKQKWILALMITLCHLFAILGCATPPTTVNKSQPKTLQRGDYFPPIAVQKQIVAQIEKSGNPEDPALSTPLTNIAFDHFQKEQYAEASALFERALRIDQKHRSNDSLTLAQDSANLAVAKCYQQSFAEAEVQVQDAGKYFYKSVGTGPNVRVIQENAGFFDTMCKCYKKFGKETEARTYETKRDSLLKTLKSK